MKPFQEGSPREFNRLYRKYDSVCHEIALASGLSDSAFSILYYIMEEGEGRSQGEIRAGIFLTKQTIHSSIRKLEKEGFLTLERGQGRDRRVRLTPAGRKLAEERILPLMELENAAFRDMDPADRRRLMDLTARYVALFQERAKEYNRLPVHRTGEKGGTP